MNPKNTMKVAQKLYEAGHITYMRTDKAVLSEEAVQAAKQWVTVQYGEEYVAVDAVKESKKKKPKVTKEEAPCGLQSVPPPQEAHEAIRPTHMEVTEIDGDNYEKKLYKLIWQRAVQSVMSAAKGETCVIKTQIKEDHDFTWSSQWTHTTFEGWKRAGKVASIEEEEQEEESTETIWKKVIHLNCGDHVQWTTMKAEPKETKAQGRYTEATLVRELEKCGIGRPSTFASLLAAIQDKDYVTIKDIPAKEVTVKEYTIKPNQWPATEKTLQKKVGAEKSKLVPTELGRSVLHFMLTHFDDLFAYGFTARMEQRLDHVANGTEPWKELLKDMWESYKDRYEELKKQPAKTSTSVKVKEFSNGLKAVMSKKGPIILREGKTKEDTQFFGWPQGLAFEQITEERANAFVEESKRVVTEIGSWKDVPIIKKSGKFGEYLQCGDVSIPYQVEYL
jgi:DNA topoisomerase-1